MATKDYRGREIIVSIKDQDDAEKKKRRGGMLPPSRRLGDPFTRRTDEGDDGIGCDIYDLGLTIAGDDIDFRHDSTINLNTTNGGYTLSNSNYTDPYNVAILSELASGAGAGRRITADNAAQYGAALQNFASNPFDNDRGFVGSGGSIAIGNAIAFHFFNSLEGTDGGLNYTKITESASYAAADADFVFDRDAELFLAPRVFAAGGSARKNISAAQFEQWAANYYSEALPRSYFLNNADWEAFRGLPMLATGYNNYYQGNTLVPPQRPSAPAAIQTTWRDLHTSRTGARVSYWKFQIGPGLSDVNIGGASFPVYDGSTSLPLFPDTGPGWWNSNRLPAFHYGDTQQHNVLISPGLFLAALRLKPSGGDPEKWFYFWRKATSSLWSLGTPGATGSSGGTFTGLRYDVRVGS